jgi:hypothetical protein
MAFLPGSPLSSQSYSRRNALSIPDARISDEPFSLVGAIYADTATQFIGAILASEPIRLDGAFPIAYPLSLVGTNFTAGDPTSWDALYP